MPDSLSDFVGEIVAAEMEFDGLMFAYYGGAWSDDLGSFDLGVEK